MSCREVPTKGSPYHLNPALVEWAYQLTKDVPLQENDAMRQERERFESPNARRPPFVLKGDTLSASTFWHGKLMNEWANDWVKYHTDGQGNYVTTAMEDTGTLQSLTLLSQAGRVNLDRVLVLRTASDFDQPPPGMSPAESLAATKIGHYVAYLEAARRRLARRPCGRRGNCPALDPLFQWPSARRSLKSRRFLPVLFQNILDRGHSGGQTVDIVRGSQICTGDFILSLVNQIKGPLQPVDLVIVKLHALKVQARTLFSHAVVT